MIPTPGLIVEYHFLGAKSSEPGSAPVVRTRPAIVQEVHGGPNEMPYVDLFVFFKNDDVVAYSFSQASSNVHTHPFNRTNVPPHVEPTAEIGVREKREPVWNTWSWPKRVP